MRFLGIILSIFLAQGVLAQSTDSLIKPIMMRGIEYFNEGKYDLSLVEYQKAWEMMPKSGWVNYEIALSHYQMDNKSKAIEYAKVAAKERSEHGVQGAIMLGTVYDQLEEYKKSIKALKKGVKKFGDYYLLWYNIGITANHARDFELAQEAFSNCMKQKMDYADAHYGLANTMIRQNRRMEALYPLYFFLLIEPTTDRSQLAVADMQNLWKRAASGDQSNQKKGDDSESRNMRAADMMLAMYETSQSLEQYGDKTEFDVFLEQTTGIFKFVGEMDHGKREDIYSHYYFPFFYSLSKSGHMETYIHFILQSVSEPSALWLKENQSKLEALFTWLDQQANKS